MIEEEIDYLVIDNFIEVRMGILFFNNNIITNNDWHLPKTEFYNYINDKLILKIDEHPKEYFYIWTKYCDLFFKFLNLYCPNVKVILNKGRYVDKIQKSDKSTYINSNITSKASIVNPFLEKLDSYIINNFDVEVLEFDYENTYLDENHMWGFGPVHYNKNFHYSLIERIKNISYDTIDK